MGCHDPRLRQRVLIGAALLGVTSLVWNLLRLAEAVLK
jgi:hypothetical protein